MGSTGNIFSGIPIRRGHKSTEFWCMVAFLIVVTAVSSLRVVRPDYALISSSIVIASYIFSRGKAKSKR